MNYTKTPVLVILFGILTVVTVLVALTVASPTFGHQHYSSVNTANGTTSGSDPAWPMFNANPANTGHIDTSGPTSNVTIGWRLELADMDEELTFAAPTVVGGTVYVGASTYHDGNGKVYAVDAESGAVRWTTPVAGSVTMTPAVADGKVNVRTSQDKVYALDAKTGEKLWEHTATDYGFTSHPQSSPTVVDGTVYVGQMGRSFGKNDLIALEAGTGDVEWKFPTDGPLRSTPAVVDGTVYFNDGFNNAYALHARNGNVEWKVPNVDSKTSVAVVNGTVYSSGHYDDGLNEFRAVFARDANTGAELWNVTTGGPATTPSVVNGRVYVGVDHRHSHENKVHSSHVFVLDATTGEKLWTVQTDRNILSPPSVVDDTVYVPSAYLGGHQGSPDGRVYAFAARTGTERWNFTDPEGIVQPLAVVDDSIYMSAGDYLYELAPPANISYQNLSVSPLSVAAGESVRAQLTVTNTGGVSGSYNR